MLRNLVFFYVWDFLGSSAAKESACNAGDPGSIPGSGKSTGERIGYLLQYSGLENLGSQSQTQLSDFHFTCYFN